MTLTIIGILVLLLVFVIIGFKKNKGGKSKNNPLNSKENTGSGDSSVQNRRVG